MAQRFPNSRRRDERRAARSRGRDRRRAARRGARAVHRAASTTPSSRGRMQKLGEHLRWQGKLPPRLKELAVLVTARRWTCQHEWVMHSKLALEGGLAHTSWKPSRPSREPENLSDEEKAVYTSAASCTPPPRRATNFRRDRERFGLDGALELIALNGYYTLMAMVLNTAGLPLPGDVQPPLSRSARLLVLTARLATLRNPPRTHQARALRVKGPSWRPPSRRRRRRASSSSRRSSRARRRRRHRGRALEKRCPVVAERRERLVNDQGRFPDVNQARVRPERTKLASARQLHVALVLRCRGRVERDGFVPEQAQALHPVAVVPHASADHAAGSRDALHLGERLAVIRERNSSPTAPWHGRTTHLHGCNACASPTSNRTRADLAFFLA